MKKMIFAALLLGAVSISTIAQARWGFGRGGGCCAPRMSCAAPCATPCAPQPPVCQKTIMVPQTIQVPKVITVPARQIRIPQPAICIRTPQPPKCITIPRPPIVIQQAPLVRYECVPDRISYQAQPDLIRWECPPDTTPC
jgi:hypothetical protein